MTMTMRAGLGVLVVGSLLACRSDSNASPKGDTPPGDAALAEADRDAPKANVGEAPLVNGKPSLELLGTALVEALGAKDGKALSGLAVAEAEYKQRLFGALASDGTQLRQGPAVAWTKHVGDSRKGLAKALAEHGGKGHAFVSLVSTRKEERGGLVVHYDPVLTLRDAAGATLTPKFLGAVVEHPASGTFLVLAFAG